MENLHMATRTAFLLVADLAALYQADWVAVVIRLFLSGVSNSKN